MSNQADPRIDFVELCVKTSASLPLDQNEYELSTEDIPLLEVVLTDHDPLAAQQSLITICSQSSSFQTDSRLQEHTLDSAIFLHQRCKGAKDREQSKVKLVEMCQRLLKT